MKVGRKKHKASLTRRLHRLVGACAAIFVLFMVLTGLALNHTHQLELDKSRVLPEFVLEWYGLGKPGNIDSRSAGNHWLSFAGSELYLNGVGMTPLTDFVGAVSHGPVLIAAAGRELVLLDQTGMIIEKVPWDRAEPIGHIGTLPDGTVVLESGRELWRADAQLLQWNQADPMVGSPKWSMPGQAPEYILESVADQYRGSGLSLERFLLDLHSGRIFGSAGIFVVDLLALAVGFLAVSGLVIWSRGRKNGKATRTRK